MKIYLHNEIDLDGQIEIVDHAYEVEAVEKGGWLYLTYQNEEKERVVLKVSPQETSMTRFSSPKSTMIFRSGEPTLTQIATPVGLQILHVATSSYQLAENRLAIAYELQIPDSQQPLASYCLQVSWG